jgi:hypothetical protein
MPQQNRFTGQNATFIFVNAQTAVATIVSNDYTELSTEFQMRTEEKTGGNDTDATYNTTIREGKATLKFWGTGEQGATVEAALREGTAGNFFVMPKGQLAGKPIIAFPVIVTHFKENFKNDKNTDCEVEMLKNGTMIQQIGALQ